MLNSMTWTEFLEWVAYGECEPFGERRADLRAGMICSTLANVNRDPNKTKPFKPTDFCLDFDTPSTSSKAGGRGDRVPVTDRSTWEGIKAMAKSLMVTTTKPKRKSPPPQPTP